MKPGGKKISSAEKIIAAGYCVAACAVWPLQFDSIVAPKWFIVFLFTGFSYTLLARGEFLLPKLNRMQKFFLLTIASSVLGAQLIAFPAISLDRYADACCLALIFF